MKLTNYSNLPDIMIEALTKDNHTLGDSEFSITQLLKTPRMLQLTRRHADEIERDAVGMWNIFIGHCVHGGIYASVKNNDDYILERRLEMEIDGVKIGGTPDAYQKSTKLLIDHKTMQTSAYGLEVKDGYEEQCNIYAYILEQQGYPVESIMLNVIYLDWRISAFKKAEYGKYPPAPVAFIPIKKWDSETIRQYIESRIALHKAAEQLEDNELPECSKDDTWETESKIAIYRPGALKASKLCKDQQEVDSWLAWKKWKPSSVELIKRPATRRRCEMYCDAAPFCNQYKEWLAKESK